MAHSDHRRLGDVALTLRMLVARASGVGGLRRHLNPHDPQRCKGFGSDRHIRCVRLGRGHQLTGEAEFSKALAGAVVEHGAGGTNQVARHRWIVPGEFVADPASVQKREPPA